MTCGEGVPPEGNLLHPHLVPDGPPGCSHWCWWWLGMTWAQLLQLATCPCAITLVSTRTLKHSIKLKYHSSRTHVFQKKQGLKNTTDTSVYQVLLLPIPSWYSLGLDSFTFCSFLPTMQLLPIKRKKKFFLLFPRSKINSSLLCYWFGFVVVVAWSSGLVWFFSDHWASETLFRIWSGKCYLDIPGGFLIAFPKISLRKKKKSKVHNSPTPT